MIIKTVVELNITAKCTKESDDSIYCLQHDLQVGEIYNVERVEMGQSNTSIYINGKSYNSVYLEFYVDNQKIDIYKSSLFNPYIKQYMSNLIVIE